jgi:hypothetical protein
LKSLHSLQNFRGVPRPEKNIQTVWVFPHMGQRQTVRLSMDRVDFWWRFIAAGCCGIETSLIACF